MLNYSTAIIMKKANRIFQKINQRPKIIFIQPGYAHYRKELFKKLAENYNILFIFVKNSSNYPSSDKADEEWNSIFLESEENKFFLLELIKILLTVKYDVIITSLSGSYQSIISYLISKLRRKVHILWNVRWYSEYKYSNNRYFYKDIRRKLSQYIIKNTDSVIVAGSASLSYHIELGVPKERIFIANQSVEVFDQKFNRSNLKDLLGIKAKYVILYLSRIINWKGLDILISAFKALENIRNDVFLLACGDGAFKNYCENLAKKLKIKNIKFTGSIRHEYIYDYMCIADVFVLPSCTRETAEAWGLVINEAMGAGKPIITTDAVGAAEDLVVNGINGYVVKNNDVKEMYGALKKIVNGGDKLIEIMGKNSRKILNEFNDYDKMFSGFKNAITNAFNKSQG